MTPGGPEASWDQLVPGMQLLAGRWALSAAALLLATLAYCFYKSRGAPGSPREGSGAAAKPTQGGEATQPLGTRSSRAEEEESPPQRPRHRGSRRKNGGSSHPCPGPAGLKGAPAGREEEEEMGEEGQREEEEEGPPSPGLQPDKQRSVLQEDGSQEERMPAARLLAGSRAAGSTDETTAGSPLVPLGSPSWASGGDGLSLPPRSSRWAGGGPQQASGGEPISVGPVEGGGGSPARNPSWTEETQLEREEVQSFRPTPDLGLASSPPHVATCPAVPSVAEIQVQENPIEERESEERSHPEPPRGNPRVHGDHLQSVSRSGPDEHSRASLEPPPSGDAFETDAPRDLEGRSQPEATPALSENGGDGALAQEVLAASPAASEREVESGPPEDPNGPAPGESPAQEPPGSRGILRRKESFHRILENPELQVPMDGFGSPAPEPPSLASSLRDGSAASLLGSRRSLRSDGGSEEPTVELVAGAKFLRLPGGPEASADTIRLDLGNCYEALCLAKAQKLDALREAAYKVMSDNYLQVLRTPAIYGQLNALERDLILQKRARGRKRLVVADVAPQGRHAAGYTGRLCFYDERGDAWHPLAHLPAEAASPGCAVCAMFNYLFVAAGCEGPGRPSRRVFCYNPLTDIWGELSPLNQARPHCRLVALDGCLYAVGGECLSTVERYDPRADRWTFAAPLPNDTFAVAHAAAACDGEIYVAGGTLRSLLLRYLPRLDAWRASLAGGNRDRTADMVAAGGCVYRFDLDRNLGLGVYRCSARAKLWYQCAARPTPVPARFRCAAVENLVHCVGRQLHLRFLADPVSPRFGTKELRHFPSPRGALFPAALVLPDRDAAGQTRV